MTKAVLEMNRIQSYKVALFQMMFVYMQQLQPSFYSGAVIIPAGL